MTYLKEFKEANIIKQFRYNPKRESTIKTSNPLVQTVYPDGYKPWNEWTDEDVNNAYQEFKKII